MMKFAAAIALLCFLQQSYGLYDPSFPSYEVHLLTQIKFVFFESADVLSKNFDNAILSDAGKECNNFALKSTELNLLAADGAADDCRAKQFFGKPQLTAEEKQTLSASPCITNIGTVLSKTLTDMLVKNNICMKQINAAMSDAEINNVATQLSSAIVQSIKKVL